MPKAQLGIRSQLIAGIVIATLAGMGLVGLFSIIAIERISLYWKVNEAHRIVEMVRVFQRSSGPFADQDAFKHAAAALKAAGVEAYEFTGRDSRVFERSGALPDEEGTDVSYSADMRVSSIGAGPFKGLGTMLYVIAPLHDNAGLVSGRLAFTVSMNELRRQTAEVRRLLFFFALFDSFIVIGLGVYFLSRSITSPIRALTAAATRISGGSLGERVKVKADNEIGSLAGSFNVMADKLEAEIKALERLNAELVSTQEELLRTSTLAAIGNLAAGIAHEVGNPLGALSGYLDILRRGATDEAEEREVVSRAISELGRIDAIVRDFLDVSRPPKASETPVEINSVVTEAVSTAQAHPAFTGVKTEMRLAEALPSLMMDDGKLRQVFINLLLNAAESMRTVSGAKTVVVSTALLKRQCDASGRMTALRRKDDRFLGKGGERVREFISVSFADIGSGISESDAARVFEPFFTTKGALGTGLGLFVSHSIIKAYGGDIAVSSGPGAGATFTVMLPSSAQDEQ